MILDCMVIMILSLLTLFILFFVFYKFYFLRDPTRKIPSGNNIVSPADGKIILLEEIDKEETIVKKGFFGKIKSLTSDVCETGYIISIFMSLGDVHYNRAPISGHVESIKYSKGKFMKANTLESTFQNENVQLVIKNNNFKIKVIQIAGFIARRIDCFVKKKEKIIKGQKIGLIKLGSQVTMIIPKNIILNVQKGQKVKAGESIIAYVSSKK